MSKWDRGTPRVSPEAPVATRRQALGIAASLPVVARAPAGDAKPDRGFLTAAELATLDELAEIIVPADAHSPGARAAGVAREIDRQLAEAVPRIPQLAAFRARFRGGLRAVDALSRQRHGRKFLAATADQRHAIVSEMAAGEAEPRSANERFFVELKRAVTRAYYTSEVGIHADLGYLGNVHVDEFVGHDASEVPLPRRR